MSTAGANECGHLNASEVLADFSCAQMFACSKHGASLPYLVGAKAIRCMPSCTVH